RRGCCRRPSHLPLRTPRRPLLFPYTTLFRSPALRAGLSGYPAGLPASPHMTEAFHGQPHAIVERDGVRFTLLGTAHVSHASVDADRKSTRLNSSHVKISYAVFCLKKNKSLLM